MSGSLRSTWQKIGERSWLAIQAAAIESVPPHLAALTRPEPGVEKLPDWAGLTFSSTAAIFDDIPGLRLNLMAETLYLFQKASHAQLAAVRLSNSGMTSWASFNAYHAALLAAKGVMGLMGVSFPKVNGAQLLVDIYPLVPVAKSKKSQFTAGFTKFMATTVPGGNLDQRYVWEALQRVLRMTGGAWEDDRLVEQLLGLNYTAITPPRNHFIYRPYYWPALEDLVDDVNVRDWGLYLGDALDPSSDGFLLHLSFAVNELLRQKLREIAAVSNVVDSQLSLSRWPPSDPPAPVIAFQALYQLA